MQDNRTKEQWLEWQKKVIREEYILTDEKKGNKISK